MPSRIATRTTSCTAAVVVTPSATVASAAEGHLAGQVERHPAGQRQRRAELQALGHVADR
jgi:hypothetical protein